MRRRKVNQNKPITYIDVRISKDSEIVSITIFHIFITLRHGNVEKIRIKILKIKSRVSNGKVTIWDKFWIRQGRRKE